MSGNLCTKHKNFHVKLKRDTERVCESRSVCVCKRVCVCTRVICSKIKFRNKEELLLYYK